jgi:2-methylcitrate dehydratase PrpD
MNEDTMTLLQALAAFVTGADASRLPQTHRDILRRHATDVVITGLAGARSAEGGAILKVFPRGSTFEGIAGSAALVRLTEMDDIHISSTTTPSSVSVPVALGLAAGSACDPAEVESAIYVGTELVVRFGLAMDGSRALLAGFWPTRTAATLGASAVASRIFGLDLAQTHEALSLAVTMMNGRTGPFIASPSGRWLVFAMAVENGIRAAAAARAGFNGGPNPPTAEWMSNALGLAVDAQRLTEGLGDGSVYPDLSMKPYATSRQTLSAIEAMRGLRADGLEPESIRRITIRIPRAHFGLVTRPLETGIATRNFMNVAAQVAIAACNADDLNDVERDQALANPRLRPLRDCTEVIADDELDRQFPARWGAQVEVSTAKGTVTRTVMDPLGSPAHPIDDEMLRRKANAILARAGCADMADRILDLSPRMFADRTSLQAICALMGA